MPFNQLQLASSASSAQSTYGLHSFPLDKYSYAVTNASETSFNSSHFHWIHHTQRDNLYFVIDTSSGSTNTYLKVIWNSQVLEYLDFTALSRLTLPTVDPLCPPQAAIIALGRPPMLAMRYPESQTMRRFQLRFTTEGHYEAAKRILESIGLHVQVALVSRGPPRPRAVVSQPPLQFQTQFQPTGGSQTQPFGTMSVGNTQVAHPSAYPFVPPEPLPPPRTLPDFMSTTTAPAVPAPSETPVQRPTNANALKAVDNLPPLRKPKPVTQKRNETSKKTTRKGKRTALVSAPPDRSTLLPMTAAVPPVPSSPQIASSKLPPPLLSLLPSSNTSNPQETALIQPIVTSQNQSNVAPSAITGNTSLAVSQQMSEMRSSPPPIPMQLLRATEQSNKRVHFDVARGPAQPVPEKGKQSSTSVTGHDLGEDCVTEVQSSQLDTEDSIAHKRKLEQERFHALENLIIDKIHDEEFCNLLVQVSKVWQRMGFEKGFGAGELFDIGNG